MISIPEIDFDTVIWKSLVLPVAAAIVTTLIVEVFAKPRLEARKQRLIRDRQQIDEVIFQFQKVSASLAALLPDSVKKSRIQERHNSIMLDSASQGLYDLMNSLSRLSHKYVEKHDKHIRRTMLFVGYIIAKVETTRDVKAMTRLVDDLKHDAQDLEYFDTYFLANVGLHDSQERWFRRVYWHYFSRNNAEERAYQVLRRHSLIKQEEGNNEG